MTNNLNFFIALLCLWCCRPTEAIAQTRALAVTLESATTTPLRVGQLFPYPLGVGIELGTYRRIRERLTLADLVIESKNRLNDSLKAMLVAERSLHQLDQLTLAQTEREYAWQTVNYQQLAVSCDWAMLTTLKGTSKRFTMFERSFWDGIGTGLLVATFLSVKH